MRYMFILRYMFMLRYRFILRYRFTLTHSLLQAVRPLGNAILSALAFPYMIQGPALVK